MDIDLAALRGRELYSDRRRCRRSRPRRLTGGKSAYRHRRADENIVLLVLTICGAINGQWRYPYDPSCHPVDR